MTETLIVLSALLGACVGGAAVWRWTSRPVATSPVPTATAPPADVLDHELERARRYERPFAMIRVPVDQRPEAPVTDPEEARAVFESLRTIDSSWIDDEGVTLLLPEVGRAEGEACLHRLRHLAPAFTRDARLVVFPEDGLTRGALLERLAGLPEGSTKSDAVPAPSRFAKTPWLAS